MNDELPQGWATAKMADVAQRITKGATPTSYGFQFLSEGISFIKVENLKDGSINRSSISHFISEEAHQNQKRSILQEGDILFSIAGTIGTTYLVHKEDLPANTNQALAIIRGTSLVFLPEFLRRQLESEVATNQARVKERGGGMHNISLEDVKEMTMLVPPLAEQRRIVAKLELLLGQVEACQQRLDKIPTLLKRFRQSVLAAACSGRLTEDWREKNEVTEEFEQTTVGAIADYIGGFAYKSPTFLKTGKNQVIRIGNVRPLILTLNASPVFIPDDIANETERFKLEKDDIVISMTGTKYKKDYGYTAIVREADGSLYINQRVARLRCGKSILPKFLLFWLQTDLFREFFFSGETGNVNQGNVGADGIRNAPIDLPSLPEQQEIVRRVERLFALADNIEQRYKKAQAFIDKLTPSLLAKAFRGELVPQDPNDEPAAVLLGRIKAETPDKLKKRGSHE